MMCRWQADIYIDATNMSTGTCITYVIACDQFNVDTNEKNIYTYSVYRLGIGESESHLQ